MTQLLTGVAWILLVQGVGGLVHETIGWFRYWGLVHHLGLSTPQALALDVLLILIGVGLLILIDLMTRSSGTSGPPQS